MGKSIKLVTLVGDEEVVVGRCHPGQARILRKNGLAEWQKDKLVLQGAPPPLPKLSTFGLPREVTEGFVAGSLAPPQGGEWKGYGSFTKKVTFQDNAWMEEAEEIDPEGLLMTFGWGDTPAYGKDLRMVPEEIQCETLAMWAGEAIKRREAGHTLLSADDPKRLRLGFVDDNTNEVLYVGLGKVKSAQESDLADLDVSRDDLRTNEGRAVLLGLDPSDARWSPIAEPDPDLEAIWVQEVEDSLGAATRKAEGIKLADEWSMRVWTVDDVREAVGLKPRDEFLADYAEFLAGMPEEVREEWDEGRRSGRTTELCLMAASTALNRNAVFMKGSTLDNAALLVTVVREMVKRCDDWKFAGTVNIWRGPGFDGALFEDHSVSDQNNSFSWALYDAYTRGKLDVDQALKALEILHNNVPEGPLYYLGIPIRYMERPEGASWKGKWMVWVDLNETHSWKVSDITEGLDKARKAIDDFTVTDD